MMPSAIRPLLLFSLAAFLAACTFQTPDRAEPPSPAPTSAPAVPSAPAITEVAATASPLVLPTRAPTRTPSPTATFPAGRDCLPSTRLDPLPKATFDDLPAVILNYLNAGGLLTDLIEGLEAQYAAAPPRPVAQADLTGDGEMETIVSLLAADVFADPKPGALLLYNCEEESFRLVQMEFPAEGFGAPRIVHIQDINADGVNELIVSSAACSEDTCYEDARILGWDGVQYRNLLEGSTADLPFPDLQITDFDLDGIFDLEVASKGFGTVAAGPQRQVIRHYAYNPQAGKWLLTFESLGASSFRIHVLHDADTALRNGDYAVALVLYGQVINEAALVDWIHPASERAVQAGYARYKSIVTYALLGDLDAAARELELFIAASPLNTPGYPYREMADAFLNGFLTTGLTDGCLAAQTYAASHVEQILIPLGPAAYGYANPEVTILDVCP